MNGQNLIHFYCSGIIGGCHQHRRGFFLLFTTDRIIELHTNNGTDLVYILQKRSHPKLLPQAPPSREDNSINFLHELFLKKTIHNVAQALLI